MIEDMITAFVQKFVEQRCPISFEIEEEQPQIDLSTVNVDKIALHVLDLIIRDGTDLRAYITDSP